MQSARMKRMSIGRSRVGRSPIGRRIHVMGGSSSGKSTLAARLAKALRTDSVELDALNWLPNWVGLNETDPARLERRIRDATAGETWVVAGDYARYCQPAFWARLDTVIWLDLPLAVLLWRMLRRSWRRSRTGELLWGSNTERFWPQLAFWRKDSLAYWLVTSHARKRRQMLGYMADPHWAHIRFVRLRSDGEIEDFARVVEGALCR